VTDDTHVFSNNDQTVARVFALVAGVRPGSSVAMCIDGKTMVCTRMQALFKQQPPDACERSVYEIVMSHAITAERTSAGGFDRCIQMLLEKQNFVRCGETAGTQIKSTCDTLEGLKPYQASADDLSRVVKTYSGLSHRGYIPSIVSRALELSGFAGRIIIEKSVSSTPSVELVRGYTFELQQLLPIDVSIVSPRVFCIDGYVEEVSEIHHLLEAAASAKEPCVVFLRGASEDVKHTLKVNYDRGSLRVIPIGVRYDLEGMNTLVDLATVCGCDLVSSLKGDMISSIKFSDAPRVDVVHINKNRVVIVNASTHAGVLAHVSRLRQRRAEENAQIEDMCLLLDKRIKSLSPNHVTIRLPNDRDFVESSQAIDYVLRAVRSMVDYGVVGDEKRLYATEIAASVQSDRCLQVLKSLGCFLRC